EAERDAEPGEAADDGRVEPPRRLEQAEIREAPEELRDRDLRLHARERRAEAEVDPVAEREVAVVGAGEVEAIGIGELTRIAVCRGDHREDALASPERLALELEVLGDDARLDEARAVPAQHLLDRGRDEDG